METLLRRLAECPEDFLGEPMSRAGHGAVDVVAVVSDLISDLGGRPLTEAQAAPYSYADTGDVRAARNRLRAILIAAWLLHDPWFRSRRGLADAARGLLAEGLDEVAALVAASKLVGDPDRREEMARHCLRGLGMRPAGESVAVAQDRLATLSSAERSRVIREAQAAEARAQHIREELRRKAEEEAAAVYGRE